MVVEAAPGDFATQFAFDQIDPNRAERIRDLLGLNLPWWQRYFVWLRNLIFDFDLGISMTSRNNVSFLVIPRMINSLYLLLPATVLIYLLAIPIGVYSAIHKYSMSDRLLTLFSLLGLAVPNFFLALIVIAFAVQMFQANGCFIIPTGGMTSNNAMNVCGLGTVAPYSELGWWGQRLNFLWHLAAPMLVVALSSLAGITRIMRGQMLEVLGQDYVRTAKAKGLSTSVVNYKHALRNAILVIIASIGSTLPSLLLGAGTVEFVMRWPGITPLFIRSIFAQDIYVVMALLTIGVFLLMVGNLLSDLALAFVDPRIRY